MFFGHNRIKSEGKGNSIQFHISIREDRMGSGVYHREIAFSQGEGIERALV